MTNESDAGAVDQIGELIIGADVEPAPLDDQSDAGVMDQTEELPNDAHVEPGLLDDLQRREKDNNLGENDSDEAGAAAGPPKKRLHRVEERQLQARSKDPMLAIPARHEKCRRKCRDKITEDERKKIHDDFWTMDYNSRKTWLVGKVRTHQASQENRIKPNRHYFFNKPGLLVETAVCQTFFLSTLGYSSHRIILGLFNSIGQAGMPKPDQLGINTPPKQKGKRNHRHTH